MTDDDIIGVLKDRFGWVSAGEVARALNTDVTTDEVTERLHRLAEEDRVFEQDTGAPPDCGCAHVVWGYKGKVR